MPCVANINFAGEAPAKALWSKQQISCASQTRGRLAPQTNPAEIFTIFARQQSLYPLALWGGGGWRIWCATPPPQSANSAKRPKWGAMA